MFKPLKPQKISATEYDRFQFLTCLNTAVHSLDDDIISVAWEQSDPYPFCAEHPTSKTVQQNLQQQIKISGLVTRRGKRTKTEIPFTGIVNWVDDTKLFVKATKN